MGTKVGKSCKVTIGANQVAGIGSFNLAGVDSDLLDDTVFGDDWKQYKIGLKDGGEITFNGLYDPDDANGQDYLRSANLNDTEVTDIRFYVDANSYWTPKTTGPASHVLVTGWEIGAEMNGMVQCSFTCKVSGAMELI